MLTVFAVQRQVQLMCAVGNRYMLALHSGSRTVLVYMYVQCVAVATAHVEVAAAVLAPRATRPPPRALGPNCNGAFICCSAAYTATRRTRQEQPAQQP